MRNIRLLMQYDGASFAGWQAQPGLPTVQVTVEEALRRLTGEEARLNGSGRTDAGVHAAGQVANFRTGTALPLKAFVAGLNSLLPPEVSILRATEEDAGFDARRSVRFKSYHYRILNAPARRAAHARNAWWVARNLDAAAMDRAAEKVAGTHDFSAFRASGCDSTHPIRTVHASRVTREGEVLLYEVTGNGFLRNMVRILAGTLVEVGRGRMTPEEFGGLVNGGCREGAGVTAPAHGLTLASVVYPHSVGESYP